MMPNAKAKRFFLLLVTFLHNMQKKSIAAFTGPIALNVKVSVKPDRRDEFLRIIQQDAAKTVQDEPDALQFALGEDVTATNTFYFHEQYKDMAAFEYHKTTPHFKEWQEFCDTDPFTDETVVNVYQCNHDPVRVPIRQAYCLNVELCIKAEVREEFLATILQNQNGSREEPLCLQYDFGESVSEPNSFYFHEQYLSKEGFDAHAAAPHFKVWESFAATEPFSKPPVVRFYQTL